MSPTLFYLRKFLSTNEWNTGHNLCYALKNAWKLQQQIRQGDISLRPFIVWTEKAKRQPKKGVVSRRSNPSNTDFGKNCMANRVFLKKRESHAQQDVWATIKRNLQWKRPLVLLVIHNPWKHHLVPKATSRFWNPNTFYHLSQCLARPRFGIMDLAPTLSDTTGDVWLLGCCFFEATRRHSPLAILWLQGIHHQTDRWIPCSKLRVSYPARVTRRWCVKMPLRNNKHIGNLVIEISSSSSSSSSKKKPS